jgi:hypothetical protein
VLSPPPSAFAVVVQCRRRRRCATYATASPLTFLLTAPRTFRRALLQPSRPCVLSPPPPSAVRPPFLVTVVAAKGQAFAAQGLASEMQGRSTTEKREPVTTMKTSVSRPFYQHHLAKRFTMSFPLLCPFQKNVPLGYIPSPTYLPEIFVTLYTCSATFLFLFVPVVFSPAFVSRPVYPASPPSNALQLLDQILTTCYNSQSKHCRCLLVPLALG